MAAEQRDPSEEPVVVQEVVVRLARPDERLLWDELMDAHHPLGFKQFAGRGLRYVAEWRGEWLALLGWQSGAFQCRPREQWLGWHKAVHFRRLHLIANNTRFVLLPKGAGVPNLGSHVLGLNLRRLSADWQQRWGHRLELAETFVEPQKYRGTVYLASNWIKLGLSKGYARSNGKYTDKHGQKKVMLVYELQAGARARMAAAEEQPEWACKPVDVRYGAPELRSLRAHLQEVEDSRSGHGKRHPLAVVLALLVLAKLAGRHGGRATEAYSKTLKQHELQALGCRWDERGREYVTPSDTTFQRVMERTDPASLERVIQRWTAPLVPPPRALAAGRQADSRGKPLVGGRAALGDGDLGGACHGPAGGEPQLPRGGRRAGCAAGIAGGGGAARAGGDDGRRACRAGDPAGDCPTTIILAGGDNYNCRFCLGGRRAVAGARRATAATLTW